MFRIVTFATDDRYRECAARMVDSAAKNAPGIPVTLIQAPDLGSWEQNVLQKAAIIEEVFYDQEDFDAVVYLDADATFSANPVLFHQLVDRSVDFAAHWRAGVELLSGTLFFRRSAAAAGLLSAWRAECERRISENDLAWDQVVLQDLVWRSGCRVEQLPASYCQIFDSMAKSILGDPVIVHHQESRQVRIDRKGK